MLDDEFHFEKTYMLLVQVRLYSVYFMVQ